MQRFSSTKLYLQFQDMGMAQWTAHHQLLVQRNCPTCPPTPCWFWFITIDYIVLVWSTRGQIPRVISNHCGKRQHAHTHSVHTLDLHRVPSAYLGLDNQGGKFTHCVHQPPFQTLGKITNRLCKCACKEVCRVRKPAPYHLWTPLSSWGLLWKAEPLIWLAVISI